MAELDKLGNGLLKGIRWVGVLFCTVCWTGDEWIEL